VQDIDKFKTVESLLAKAFGEWRPAFIALEVPCPSAVSGVIVSMTAIAWIGADKPTVI
jgi:predicted transporter